MTRILQLKCPNGEVLSLERNAHFGRSRSLRWKTDRSQPPQFQDLEVAVRLWGEGTEGISRNHMGIYRTNGEFSVVDLNSANGTFLNDQRLTGGQQYLLKPGDVITVDTDHRFTVLGYRDPAQGNYALFVGNSGGDLEGVENDLEQMVEVLSPRGFAGNTTVLRNEGATKRAVLGYLWNLRQQTTDSSHTLLYFSGHSGKHGIPLGGERLSPAELYASIDNLRGRKALLIDGCHTNVFLESEFIPPHTLVVGAPGDCNGIEHEVPVTVLGGRPMGTMSKYIRKYFTEHPETFNLRALGDYLKQQLPDASLHQPRNIVAGTMVFTIEPRGTNS